MPNTNPLLKLSRFATWMSTFPQLTHSAIRLHEIAWMHAEPGHVLSSPPIRRLLFIYILHGEGEIQFGEETYSFRKGNAILFDMEEPYRATSDSGMDFVSIQMSSALAETLYNYVYTENGIILSGGPELLAVAEQIYTLASGKWSPRADIEISAALYRLLGLLHTQPAGQSQIEAALLQIHAHYMEELPLEELAACCRMSLYHFIRCFKRDMGMTPHAYIQGYRIQKAKELLIQTDLPIAAIAAFVGYSDPSHFSALFRSVAGCLPRQYRQIYGK